MISAADQTSIYAFHVRQVRSFTVGEQTRLCPLGVSRFKNRKPESVRTTQKGRKGVGNVSVSSMPPAMRYYFTLHQLATAKKILLIICPVVLVAYVLIIFLSTNVAAIVVFGVLYVALVTALGVVSVRIRRRTRAVARRVRIALEMLERAGALPGPEGVFVIGRQSSPAVSGQTQAFSQTHAQRPADDDPPPPYSELPLDVRDKGARVGENVVRAPTPRVHATRPSRSTVEIQSTSAVNENVHWNANSKTEPGRRLPKPRASSAHVHSATAINEKC